MARIKQTEYADSYVEIRKQAKGFMEKADCAVVAVAAVTGLSYAEAHALTKKNGRKEKHGMSTAGILASVREAGKETKRVAAGDFIKLYPKAHQILKSVTTHHPDRFPEVWKDGNTYLMFTATHVLAIVDGLNCDWTRGRALRAMAIYKIM